MESCARVLAAIWSLMSWDSCGRARAMNSSSSFFLTWSTESRGNMIFETITNQIAKGNVFVTARIAGIQAAKQTAHLIPLCHTLSLGQVTVDIVASKDGAEVKCTAQTVAQTGVEMEALVGVTVALLTIYDMCKAVDKEMQISDVRLISKTKHHV